MAAVTSLVGAHVVPDAVRALTTLPDPDYVDLFTVATLASREHSAEEWARAILEEAPLARRGARKLWRLMGLRLGPAGSPDHVQGWTIVARGDDWLQLETGSWYLTAQAVCLVEDDRVSISLSLRYDRFVAAPIWRLVEERHQRAVPVMLRQGVKLLTVGATTGP